MIKSFDLGENQGGGERRRGGSKHLVERGGHSGMKYNEIISTNEIVIIMSESKFRTIVIFD